MNDWEIDLLWKPYEYLRDPEWFAANHDISGECVVDEAEMKAEFSRFAQACKGS